MAKENKSKTCFVISPIGDIESETRKRSDKVLKHIIEPCVSGHGYNPVRADQISEPGIITTQVIQYINDSPLVIADLTEHNPNVFYELAIRHAIKKPLIQIIERGEQIPFDVAPTRIIQFDIQDLDSVELAKADINNQIENINKGKGEYDNPISISLELQLLKESGNPEKEYMADLVNMMAEMRSGISILANQVSDPSKLLPPEYVNNLLRMKPVIRSSPKILNLTNQIQNGLGILVDRIELEKELSKDLELKQANIKTILVVNELRNISDQLTFEVQNLIGR